MYGEAMVDKRPKKLHKPTPEKYFKKQTFLKSS